VYRYKKKRKNGVKIVLQLVATYWNICHACCLYVVHAMHNVQTHSGLGYQTFLFWQLTYWKAFQHCLHRGQNVNDNFNPLCLRNFWQAHAWIDLAN